MNIEFKEKSPASVIQDEIIMIDGVKVGEMKAYKRDWGISYHASFKLSADTVYFIQGHAVAKEQAIINAIENGKRIATEALAEIYQLEIKLNGGAL